MNGSRISATATPRPTATLSARLEASAHWLDQRTALIVALLGIVYVVLISPFVHRHLWFDELHTFYIAQAPSMRQFVEELRTVDLNPPLMYALVRVSMNLFGATELAARLPMIIGYFIGSICMLVFMSRRVGALWGAAGVGLFWYSQYFYFATEARPYGILVGCLGLTLVSWDYATETRHRRWALAGVAVGATAMLLTHVYAILWILPFWVAELVRGQKRGRLDWPLLAAMVLPSVACLLYLPLIQNVAGAVFPPMFQGSVARMLMFYLVVFFQASPPLAAGSLLAFAAVLWSNRRPRSEILAQVPSQRGLPRHELAFFLASLAPPALLNANSMYRHIAFYDRHAILTVLTANMLILLFIAHEAKGNRLAGMIAALVILAFNLMTLVAVAKTTPAHPQGGAGLEDIRQIHPDLPLVANGALTFLEMDHYEDTRLLARLYYLVDQKRSIQYGQSNLTEGLLTMKEYFPIRANVFRYDDFVAAHRHFLVWGVMDQQGWLLRSLKAEGARVINIGKFDTPYADSQLSEVWLNP